MAAADIVTTVGKGLISAALVASTHKYIAWGTGSTTAAAADTTLTTASAEARTSGTQSQTTTTTTNDTYTLTGTITSLSTQGIFEVGVFSASTVGSMFSHHSFAAAVNLVASDAIAFTLNYKAA